MTDFICIGRMIIDIDELFYVDRQSGEYFQIRKLFNDGSCWCRRIRPLWIPRLWWICCREYVFKHAAQTRELKPILTVRPPQ